MRMWMTDPRILCRLHLLGEHRECHATAGSCNPEPSASILGLVKAGMLELHNLQSRHDELVEEMFRRGYYGHVTPLEFSWEAPLGVVDRAKSFVDLYTRCLECRRRIYHYYKEWVDSWLASFVRS